MSAAVVLLDARRAALLAALVVLIAAVYMLTYSGRIESGDSLLYFNATASLVRFGDTDLDLSLWMDPPEIGHFDAPYPLEQLSIESWSPPLQPLAAAPLYWIAYHLPGFGLVHTVWLFNILVIAATCGILFLYALALGYAERTALLGALLLGLGTILWPYSKTFFRDPLAMLLLLLAGLLLERLRAARYHSRVLIGALALTLLAALHTKITVLYGLPGLVVIGLPALRPSHRIRWVETLLDVLPIVAAAVTAYLAFGNAWAGGPLRQYSALSLLDFYPYYARLALHTYLFSVGGSLWGTSPVGLLALPGLWVLYRQRRRRYIWVTILVVLGFSYGYALLANQHWFGGLSWPPRFLIPAVPYMVLAALPALDRLARRSASVALSVMAVILFAYSLWVQFNGVALDWGAYNAVLPPQAGGLSEWRPGLNNVHYLRWVLLPSVWLKQPLDFAWIRLNLPAWPLAFGSLALVCAGILWHPQGCSPRRAALSATAVLAAFVILTAAGLQGIASDVMYRGTQRSLHDMIGLVDSVTQPGDMLVVAGNHYERFLLNYGKLRDARVIILPNAPGERPGPDEPAPVTSGNPDALLVPETVPMLYVLARRHDRLWLLMDAGPFIPWAVRPVERFMSTHFYPIRELQTDPPDPAVRLVEYSTVSAPDPFAYRSPQHSTQLRYGEHIRLLGVDLPGGMVYTAGAVLPVSLYWQSSTALDVNYTVAMQVVGSGTQVVASAMDSQPGGGFAPTSTWQEGIAVWDNRAVVLPDDLPSGDYSLWVTLYTIGQDGTIQPLPVAGGETAQEAHIGVLPLSIRVAP